MFSDLLKFRKMVAPVVIEVCYWVFAVGFLLSGVGAGIAGFYKLIWVPGGASDRQAGLYMILVAIVGTIAIEIVIRVAAEIAILFFRINETLTDIRANTAK